MLPLADLTLLLCGGPQRVLDAAAIEAVNRLKLVERHHDRAFLFSCEATWQREDLVGKAVDVALVLDEWELHREATGPGGVGVVPHLGAR